jgi:hypothetical protein
MRHLWATTALPIIAACAGLSHPAQAQIAATVVGTCGTPPSTYSPGQAKPVTQDTTGTLCSSSGGGGGSGVAGFTAEATATAESAGTNQPAGVDTANKAQRVEICVPGATGCIDLSGGTAGTPAGAVSSVQGVSGMVPVDTNIKQINGAAPSLTNPIFVANAEAADTTGTFTNATQTTSVTNSSADGYAGGLISINGTYATASGVFEASDDGGTTFYSVICARSDGSAQETGYTTLTNTNRQWFCPVGGNDSLRVRSTAVATGTVNVRVGISAPPPEALGGTFSGAVTNAGTFAVQNTAATPAGTNLIGKVGIDQTTPGTTNATAIKDVNNVAPDFAKTVPTAQVGPYPSLNTAGTVSSATPETCSSGNVANATVACTLAASSGKTTYITGFTMTADGATTGLAVSCTLTGTITGTMTYTFSYPLGVAVQAQPLAITFPYPVPASATNTTIVASCPASGTGGTNAAISATGFQL